MSLQRTSTGATVNLGQLIGRGGEGTVHVVIGAPKLVAKVYLKPPDAAKAEKLRLMIRGQSPGLLGVAAWPVDLLTDERGAVRGFLMARISARQDAHRLYSPKSRRRTFPDADFRFVVRAATNLARAFAQIHAARHVIGDVNHGNALIGKDGTAVLIDCDSIQVREQSRTFPCDVGTPLFTPPELQGKAFRGLRRTEASDRFGLAVLLFHLLFQGRHPFAGVFAGGEMPLERAIAESRFAYGAHAAALGMSAPPGTLPLTTFGRPIARLFERAFAPPGGEEERPSAIEWIEPLQILESGLVQCTKRPRHFYPGGPGCCWCEVETLTGARLFDAEQSTADVDAVTAQELWRAIDGVRPPVAEVEPPPIARKTFDTQRPVNRLTQLARMITGDKTWTYAFYGLLILMGLIPRGVAPVVLVVGAISIIAAAFWVNSSSGQDTWTGRVVRLEWERALKRWRKNSSAHDFFRVRNQLAELHVSLIALDQRRKIELDLVARRLEERQKQAFLDTFEIGKAMFLEVMRFQVEKMASRGIRSAGDIMRYRGSLHECVSPAGVNELRKWADQCEKEFKLNAHETEYRDEAGKVESRFQQQRESIIADLRRGPELLATKRDEIANARAKAEGELRQELERLRRRRESEKS